MPIFFLLRIFCLTALVLLLNVFCACDDTDDDCQDIRGEWVATSGLRANDYNLFHVNFASDGSYASAYTYKGLVCYYRYAFENTNKEFGAWQEKNGSVELTVDDKVQQESIGWKGDTLLYRGYKMVRPSKSPYAWEPTVQVSIEPDQPSVSFQDPTADYHSMYYLHSGSSYRVVAKPVMQGHNVTIKDCYLWRSTRDLNLGEYSEYKTDTVQAGKNVKADGSFSVSMTAPALDWGRVWFSSMLSFSLNSECLGNASVSDEVYTHILPSPGCYVADYQEEAELNPKILGVQVAAKTESTLDNTLYDVTLDVRCNRAFQIDVYLYEDQSIDSSIASANVKNHCCAVNVTSLPKSAPTTLYLVAHNYFGKTTFAIDLSWSD